MRQRKREGKGLGDCTQKNFTDTVRWRKSENGGKGLGVYCSVKNGIPFDIP